MKKKNSAGRACEGVLMTLAGTALIAVSSAFFILPSGLIIGGVSGASLIIASLIPEGALPLDLIISLLSIGLFILGALVLGRDFAKKTAISSIFYPIFLSIITRATEALGLSGYFDLANSALGNSGLILAAVFGGVILGAGVGLAFAGGGSSGGVDIPALILCKYFTGLRPAAGIIIIDSVIVTLGAFVTGNFVLTLLGIATTAIAGYFTDKLLPGDGSALLAHIITEHPDEISERIILQMSRTTTNIRASGAYSKRDKNLLLVTFSLREYSKMREIIAEVDSGAFVIFGNVKQIYGEGWGANQ